MKAPLPIRLLLGCCSLLLWVGITGCGAEQSEVVERRAELQGDSKLIGYFREAEAQTRVPAELLATLAWVQSGMSMNREAAAETHAHGEDGHVPQEYGLMAIGGGGLTTLEAAAESVALTPSEVATDERTNVRAGAHLLAAFATTSRSAPRTYADWAPALEAYGGAALSDTVLRLLGTGFATVDDDAKAIRVRGTGDTGTIGTVQQALGYPGAIWSPAFSGNYTAASRGAATIDYIVIHTVQGSYAGAISWFKNPSSNVSAHYVVRSSDGQITQCVDDTDIAWHDACFNTPTIGIEHEGFVSEPGKWYTDAMYKSSAKLAAWLSDKYGIPKDRKHILGHGEAPDCSTHTDPGSGWNWTKYMELVKTGGVADKDGDGVGDSSDNCPSVANKGQTDTDKDGKGDACDGDDDGDGIGDAKDNCPKHDNAQQTDTDDDGKGNACDADNDNDGVLDTKDNCDNVANKGQLDTDKDGKGNACDGDDDGDGVADTTDNCPTTANKGQLDSDKDGKGDACELDDDGDGAPDASDNCPKASNADQLDTDADAKGDACDLDDDGDGVNDDVDECPLVAGDVCDADSDGDGVLDKEDICPNAADPDQIDTDEDGAGDACDDDDDGDGVADSEDQCPLAAPGSDGASAATGLGCDAEPQTTDSDDPVDPSDPANQNEAPPSTGGGTVEDSGGCNVSPSAPLSSSTALLLLAAAIGLARRRGITNSRAGTGSG